MQTKCAQLGETVFFEKTVSESDVYMFAGITGDLAPNHVNEAFMRSSIYGKRIVHGALLIGFMSTASTSMVSRAFDRGCTGTPVSLGYDRIRFLGPVFLGDTIKVTYKIVEVDEARLRTRSAIEVTNEDGTLVAVAEHILKWLERETDTPGH